jgi:hypothetical protein
MIVRIKMPGSMRKPLAKDLQVEIRGPCDTGSIVSTATGFVLGKISRLLPLGGIEIEVESSVYEKFHREGWKDAY